jgi:hypothetical protein
LLVPAVTSRFGFLQALCRSKWGHGLVVVADGLRLDFDVVPVFPHALEWFAFACDFDGRVEASRKAKAVQAVLSVGNALTRVSEWLSVVVEEVWSCRRSWTQEL